MGDTVMVGNKIGEAEMSPLAGLALLLARGFLLWLVLPLTYL